MIQRLQSIWLLLAAIAAFVTYTLTLYKGNLQDGSVRQFLLADNFFLVVMIVAIGLLAAVSIFLFKNRKLQFRLAVLGVILSVAYIVLEYFKVEQFKTANAVLSGSYQLGALLPFLIPIFFFLAARGIYRDEKLVKSMSRLR
jgi:FtsH-binding integral membrane protein